MSRSDRGPILAIILALGLVVLGAAAWHDPIPRMTVDPDMPVPRLMRHGPGIDGELPPGLSLRYTTDGSEPGPASASTVTSGEPDQRQAHRLMRYGTSPQWRAPVPGDYADAIVWRARYCDADGRCGPVTTRTWLHRAEGLPVLSLALPEGAFFDPDTGIYVVGHGVFRSNEIAVQRYPRDQKWWKYPGNYQFRGKRWERAATLELLSPEGGSLWNGPVRVRINGNNTRGFPHHALRLSFDAPLKVAVFDAAHGAGYRGLVLRAGGNDQDHAFLRDALQHRLCADMPFMTSAYKPCVLLVNGVYWGLHDLRERMDDREVARRTGLPRKQVTILADRAILYDGDAQEVGRFNRMLTRMERWDTAAPGFTDSLDRYIDVEGFLQYMAAQIILGNADWPDQNVKYWRYTGTPDTLRGPRDGRWRFIMGDSDQGFGYPVGADFDSFGHVLAKATPVPRLFKVCLRAPAVRDRFRSIVLEQLSGPLATARMEALVRELAAAVEGEMPRQVDRWRRPVSMAVWRHHVDLLLTFARERGTQVRGQLDRHFPAFPPA